MQIYLSDNRNLTTSDPLLLQTTIPQVKAGESRKVTFKFNFPDVVAGNYYLAVQVDPTNAIAEKNEQNNVAFTTATLPVTVPFTDLAPTILSDLPAAVVGGDPGRVKIRIENKGTATYDRTAAITLYASADAVLDATDVSMTTIPDRPLRIGPGGHKDVRVGFNYPTSLPDGTYFVIAKVDPGTAVVDADPTNNTSTSATPVRIQAPFVDLRADTIHVATGPLGAGTNRVDVTVSNLGNVPVVGPLTISLSAVPPGLAGTETALGQVTRVVKIGENGGRKTFRITFLLPLALPRGTYFLHARVDPDQHYSERDETNNDVFTVNPYPTP